MKELQLLGVFSVLSLLSVGGSTAILPEMDALVVRHQQWISEDQFRDIYALGQITPGPNMLLVIVLGYHVSGVLGAALAFWAFFLPACVLCIVVSRAWTRFESSPWRLAIQQGLAPVVIGLMLAGTSAIARIALAAPDTEICIALATGVFALLYFGKNIHPTLLVLGGGILGFFLLR